MIWRTGENILPNVKISEVISLSVWTNLRIILSRGSTTSGAENNFFFFKTKKKNSYFWFNICSLIKDEENDVKWQARVISATISNKLLKATFTRCFHEYALLLI